MSPYEYALILAKGLAAVDYARKTLPEEAFKNADGVRELHMSMSRALPVATPERLELTTLQGVSGAL